jgi:hypothetical protein
MSCPQHDALLKDVVEASIAYDWWRDTPSAHLSPKKRSEGRAGAKTVCDGKDYLLNTHIRECAVCQEAGRLPTHNSTASHHF